MTTETENKEHIKFKTYSNITAVTHLPNKPKFPKIYNKVWVVHMDEIYRVCQCHAII